MMQIWPIQFILTLQKNTSYKVKQYTQRRISLDRGLAKTSPQQGLVL